MAKINKAMMAIVCDNVEQLEVSCTVRRGINWCNHIGKLFDRPTEVEYTHTLWPSSCISKYIPNVNVYIYLLMAYTDYWWQNTQSHCKLERKRMLFNNRVIHSQKGTLWNDDNENTTVHQGDLPKHNIETKKARQRNMYYMII